MKMLEWEGKLEYSKETQEREENLYKDKCETKGVQCEQGRTKLLKKEVNLETLLRLTDAIPDGLPKY